MTNDPSRPPLLVCNYNHTSKSDRLTGQQIYQLVAVMYGAVCQLLIKVEEVRMFLFINVLEFPEASHSHFTQLKMQV